MSKNLCNKVEETGQDNLIAMLFPPAETFGVKISAGVGVLKRGTVLALSEDGIYDICGKSTVTGEGEDMTPEVSTVRANCILADDVDASEAEAVGVAYRTGHFNRKALIVADGYTLTIADEEELRKGGILLSDMAT